MNLFFPIINLYKISLFKSVGYNDNELNNTINNFCFDELYYIIDNSYNFNNYLKNKKNIFEDTLSKLNNETKIIDKSLDIYTKGINFIFSKINFNYKTKEDNIKSIKLNNPFIISTIPKMYSNCIKELKKHKDEIFCVLKLSNGNFATGSGDGLVLVWDQHLLELGLTIHAHKGGVNC